MSDTYFEEDALWEGRFDRHILWRLLSYARPHLRLVAGIGVLVLLTTADRG